MSPQYKYSIDAQYSIDAGVLITAHRHRYSKDEFNAWCVWFEKMIAQGKVFLCNETFEEITQGDYLYQWAREQKKRHPAFVKQTAGHETNEWRKLLEVVPQLAHPKSAGDADQLVIAHAAAADATVVTEEKPSRDTTNTVVKIPDVCAKIKIPCMNLVEFMRQEGARF